MAEKHSKVKIKRTDGATVTLTFKELMEADEDQLREQVYSLEEWLSSEYGLKKYQATIPTQIEELKGVWDEGHTLALRKAMSRCAEQLDEAIQRYEIALADLTILVSARRSLVVWLGANPDYNRPHFKDQRGDDCYYCKMKGQTSRTATDKHRTKTTYVGDPITLDYPAK